MWSGNKSGFALCKPSVSYFFPLKAQPQASGGGPIGEKDLRDNSNSKRCPRKVGANGRGFGSKCSQPYATHAERWKPIPSRKIITLRQGDVITGIINRLIPSKDISYTIPLGISPYQSSSRKYYHETHSSPFLEAPLPKTRQRHKPPHICPRDDVHHRC